MEKGMSKDWFEVSRQGLKTLQAGKPKHYIVRELIQNAWDEEITYCEVGLSYDGKEAQIKVVDNNPEGFRDLADAYTLFKNTQKRLDPTKRGRFNIGEKQALALSDRAKIATTKGTILFEKAGRRQIREKKDSGSELILWVQMKRNEFEEIMGILKRYIPPKGIKFILNGDTLHTRTPEKVIEASLKTELEENGMMGQIQRKTEVLIYRKVFETAMLYEMGIPVCEIDCLFDISVQQRVPLGIDRETVPMKYLSDVYAEVLNETHEEIEKDDSSDIWVREAMSNKRATSEAVKEMVEKRYGEKAVVANPFDPNSIDEAISRGYNVVYGSELSRAEWDKIKESKALATSSQLFGSSFVGSKTVDPTEEMIKIGELAKRIAKRVLGIKIEIRFLKWESSHAAEYGDNCLTFNVSRLSKSFWQYPIKAETIDLIVHELAHHKGNHTEMNYHDCLSELAGELVIIALKEPKFFE